MSTTAQAQQQALAPGTLYGTPGNSLYTEQVDQNDQTPQTMQQGNSVQVLGMDKFQQVDIVFWWELEVAWTNNLTPGSSAITTSPYFPYNVLTEGRLKVQNQYDSYHWLSGVDAAIFQMLRPVRHTGAGLGSRTNLDANPSATWATTSLAQANLNTQTAMASTTTAINFTLDLPVSKCFDMYFDLSIDGQIVSQPHRAIVSPQYMGGSARVVQPFIGVAAGSSATLDNGPFNIGAGTGSYSGSVTLGFRKVGVYSSNNRARNPVVYNWQYARDTSVFSLAGVTRKDVPISTYGQILLVYIRLFDPSANGALGAPININTITKCQLLFGSGLKRFDDTPKSAQRRILRQHGILLPVGVLAWDLGLDDYGRLTNANALNTLVEAGIVVHLEFTGALSSTAYGVLGIEYLTYVV